jgi:hypothetical protein
MWCQIHFQATPTFAAILAEPTPCNRNTAVLVLDAITRRRSSFGGKVSRRSENSGGDGWRVDVEG